ncbi:MAG: hypothetical protein LUG57_02880 [Oscillospiraceae bacterium]|nr:hypothetical protein [Oscillospiraceae bacterium]
MLFALLLSAGAFASSEEPAAEGELVSYEGQLGHLESSGDEHSELSDDDVIYTAAIFVDGDGVNGDYSNLFLCGGTEVTDDGVDGLAITDSTVGLNAVLVTNHDYTITNAEIILNTESDGLGINDFTGRGTAIAVFGDSNVVISDSYIETCGVGVMPVFADSSADEEGNALSPVVTIERSTLISHGGTVYADYANQFGADLMVAPPWVLGIMGTSRCTNLEGEYATMNVVDCDVSAGAWAVLSTDMPTGVYLNVVNTTLSLLNADESAAAAIQEEGGQIETKDNPYTVNYGTGYGTYANGGEEAWTTFLGCEINVGTYAVIFTGGNQVFGSLTPGEEIELPAATGNEEDSYFYTYTGDEVKNTVINSDTFGFMFHEQVNTAAINAGTEIHSGYATFLVKSGKAGVVEDPSEGSKSVASDVVVDGAVITNGGVLIQVMDDDDSSTGQEEENFKHFVTVHTEQAGFADVNSTVSDLREQNFTFTNGDYTGNIYNSSGSDRSENDPYDVATTLNITLGENATLIGAAAATTAIHVTYEGSLAVKENGGLAFEDADEAAEFAAAYQNTEFTISEYYDIGQVANLIGTSDGANDINVTLTDNAVWYVTAASVIDTLTIADDASVVVAEGVTLTVGGQIYEAGTYTAD